jgi:hypothetical protein
MATDAKEHLMAWLRDARAMEEQSETILECQIGRIKHYPQLKEKLQSHLTQTRRQSMLVRECIERRGGNVSPIKELAAKTIATAQGLSGLFVDDGEGNARSLYLQARGNRFLPHSDRRSRSHWRLPNGRGLSANPCGGGSHGRLAEPAGAGHGAEVPEAGRNRRRSGQAITAAEPLAKCRGTEVRLLNG